MLLDNRKENKSNIFKISDLHDNFYLTENEKNRLENEYPTDIIQNHFQIYISKFADYILLIQK